MLTRYVSCLLIYKSKNHTSKSSQNAPLNNRNLKNFLGEGAHRAPLPKPLPRFFSALGASIRASRGLGASRLAARFARICSCLQNLHRSRKNPAYATGEGEMK